MAHIEHDPTDVFDALLANNVGPTDALIHGRASPMPDVHQSRRSAPQENRSAKGQN